MARPTLMRGGVYDKQLEELVQASSWKQAFTLCEKRIKKGDKSEESLVSLEWSIYKHMSRDLVD